MCNQQPAECFIEAQEAFGLIDYKPLRLNHKDEDPNVAQRMIAVLLNPWSHKAIVNSLGNS